MKKKEDMDSEVAHVMESEIRVRRFQSVMQISLENEQGPVSTLDWSTGKLAVEGDVEESGKLFFEFLKPYVDSYIESKLKEESEGSAVTDKAYLAWPRFEDLCSPGGIVRAYQMVKSWNDEGIDLSAESGDFVIRFSDGFYTVFSEEEFAKHYRLLSNPDKDADIQGTPSPRLGRVSLRLPVQLGDPAFRIRNLVLRGNVIGSAWIPGDETEQKLIVALDDCLRTTAGVKLNFIIVQSKYVTYTKSDRRSESCQAI